MLEALLVSYLMIPGSIPMTLFAARAVYTRIRAR